MLIAPKTLRVLTKVLCFSGPNLVIQASTGDELSCGQASDWYTLTETKAKTMPGGQNWPRVKNYFRDSRYVNVTFWSIMHMFKELRYSSPHLSKIFIEWIFQRSFKKIWKIFELSRGQAWSYWWTDRVTDKETDGWTDRRAQATTIPLQP